MEFVESGDETSSGGASRVNESRKSWELNWTSPRENGGDVGEGPNG